ncbi:MAG: protein kinase [Deltaproteobacteria bacterium]|nr:protein kinase [Deltaproteobacteria bacterium]
MPDICPICGNPMEADHECPTGFIDVAPAPAASSIGPGSVLGGTYRLLAPLAKGGMSVLYEAEHVRLGSKVAVKVLKEQYAEDQENIGRFCREAQIAGAIEHDGIVRVFDVNCEAGGFWYIAMELLRGTDVRSLLRRRGPLSVERAVDIARQVCLALSAAHARQVIHRDIKPSNVFLVERGDGLDHAKLLDFGISKLLADTSGATKVGLIIGTPQFMSPEQACGDPSIDHRTDVFSTGALLYKMLTGHSPFEAPSPAAVLARLMTQPPHPIEQWGAEVPSWLVSVVLRCLNRDPDARFWSALELAETLARRDETLAPPPPVERPTLVAEPWTDELRVVTVLFASLPGRTHPPTDASSSQEGTDTRRDPLSSRAREILRRHGAVFQRYFGDGLMAVFGVPSATGDEALRAVRAALELKVLPAELELPGEPLRIRVGLSTGRVVAGRMRGVSSAGYGVVGQAVDLARQIEGLGGPDSVLLCPETYLHVRGRFRVRPAGHLFGHDGAQAVVYQALEEYPHGLLVPPREVLGARTPLVGRAAELGRLVERLGQAFDEHSPQLVTVVGPAGIGKTRLAYELRCHVEESERDVVTFAAQAQEMAAAAPLQLWTELLRAKIGIHADEPSERSVEKVRQFVDRTVDTTVDDSLEGEGPEVARALALLLGLSSAGLRTQPLVEQAGSTLAELFRRIALRSPVLVVLDDLQWADQASLEVLAWSLERLEHCPLFVLGLARPELGEGLPQLLTRGGPHGRASGRKPDAAAGATAASPPDPPRIVSGQALDDAPLAPERREEAVNGRGLPQLFTLADRPERGRLVLGRLDRADGAELVRRITGDGVTDASATAIAERADGVPLFIEEILHGLAERGVLTPKGRAWVATHELEEPDLPLTVEAVIQARLDRLEPNERDVLRKAAVIGETFWFGTLRAIGEPEAARVLPKLMARELVRLQPTSRFAGFMEYAFAHKLVRDVAYAGLPFDERRRVHLAVGQWLETRGGESLESRALAARHYEAGEDWMRAATAWLRAGEAAHELFACRDGQRHFEAAARLADRAGDPKLHALARGGLGRTLARAGNFRDARAHLEVALRDVGSLGRPDQEWRVLQALAQCCAADGDEAKALQHVDRAAGITRKTHDRLGSCELEKSRCILHYFAGRDEEAVEAARRAVLLARELKLPRELALNLSNVGTLEALRGRTREALEALRESTSLSREHGIDALTGINQAFLGYLLVLGEKDASGAEQIERSLQLARERHWVWDEVQELYLLGHARLLLGRPAEARGTLERCVELARQHGERRLLQEAGRLLASLGTPPPAGS